MNIRKTNSTKRDLTNKKFNRWLVIEPDNSYRNKDGKKSTYWVCRCDCGTIKSVFAGSLVYNKSISCGCFAVEKSRLGSGQASANFVYARYKRNASTSNREFSLTKEQFMTITSKDCYYCGKAPSNIKKRGRCYGSHTYNGIDRVDNNLGYILTNVVPCCKNCNMAKKELSQYEFFDMIKMIYEKHISSS